MELRVKEKSKKLNKIKIMTVQIRHDWSGTTERTNICKSGAKPTDSKATQSKSGSDSALNGRTSDWFMEMQGNSVRLRS